MNIQVIPSHVEDMWISLDCVELLQGLKFPSRFDRSESPVLEGNEFLTMGASSLWKWYVVLLPGVGKEFLFEDFGHWSS